MTDRQTMIDPPVEAFGQRSAGRYFALIVIAMAMVCSGVSLAMWNRSHKVSDAFYKDSAEGRLAVRSIYGRIVITRSTLAEPRSFPIGNDWNYSRSRVPRNITDGWPPGFWKTVGIQQGYEPNPLPGVAEEWWLRIRWPTLAFTSALLPALYLLRRSWRERAIEKMEEEYALK